MLILSPLLPEASLLLLLLVFLLLVLLWFVLQLFVSPWNILFVDESFEYFTLLIRSFIVLVCDVIN